MALYPFLSSSQTMNSFHPWLCHRQWCSDNTICWLLNVQRALLLHTNQPQIEIQNTYLDKLLKYRCQSTVELVNFLKVYKGMMPPSMISFLFVSEALMKHTARSLDQSFHSNTVTPTKMSKSTALQTFSLTNNILQVSPQDEIYRFDADANRKFNQEMPWTKE